MQHLKKKIIELKLKDIKKDDNFKTRKVTDYKVRKILDLLETGYFPPPIQVVLINKIYFVIDGWHRLEAYNRAGIPDYKIQVELVEGFKDYKEIRLYAALQNDHGWPYTEEEKQSLLKEFVKDGISIKKARECLKISDKQLVTWGGIDFVLIGGNDRAKELEKTMVGERAGGREETTIDERATTCEKTREPERAIDTEKTNIIKRATVNEKPIYAERADGIPALFYIRKLTEWIESGKVSKTKESKEAIKSLYKEIKIFLEEK